MTATKPRIWTGDHPKLDTLEAVAGVQVAGSALKPGMVLLDPDLMTPAVSLDKKVRSARNSGEVSFLVFDLDGRTYDTVAVGANSMIWVAAA